jgi:hypothetical protein
MNQTLAVLFAIPVVTIVVFALYQFFDEMFKKHFVLERRAQRSGDEDSAGAPRRRYSDSVASGAPRHPETAVSSTAAEAPVAQVQQS